MQRFLLSALCLCTALNLLTGQTDVPPFFTPANFSTAVHAEKAFIDTDRSYYMTGETIYFKAYLTDESLRQQQAESAVLYVDLIDGEGTAVVSRKVAMVDGSGQGDIALNRDLPGGFYTLRAHTAFMRNHGEAFFFRKQVLIKALGQALTLPAQEEVRYQLRGFPEGGDLVVGLTCKVAVKAMTAAGAGMAVEGSLQTADGEGIGKFTTNELGFGLTSFRPEPGESYVLAADFAGEGIVQALPPALTEGAVLSVESGQDAITVSLSASPGYNAVAGGWLFGHARGKIVLQQELGAGGHYVYTVSKEEMPTGVVHFTAFDKTGHPVAERLVFNDRGVDAFNVDFSLDKEIYNKRELVQLHLDVYDDEGDALEGDFSVSVIEGFLDVQERHKHDIRSYLLLGGDLPVPLYQPQAYFADLENGNAAIDLLLLTHGWRRFRWKDLQNEQYLTQRIGPEKGLTLSGTVTEKDHPDRPVVAHGFLSELSAAMSIQEFETDSEGRFSVQGLQSRDSVDLILQAAVLNRKKMEKGKEKDLLKLKGNRNVDIVVDKPEPLPAGEADLELTRETVVDEEMITLLQNRQIAYAESGEWDGLLSIDIDEVTVSEERIDPVVNYYEEGMMYKRPNTRIMTDAIPHLNQYRNIYDILRGRVAGMKIDAPEEPGVQHSIILRGYKTGLSQAIKMSNAAQFAVNGAWVSTPFAESIHPSDIAFVDVISSMEQLTMYGELGVNGIIMIYLKPPGSRLSRKRKTYQGILNFIYQGYDTAREFYAPDYSIPKDNESGQPDERTTLHWAPSVMIGDSGEATLEFYTGDRTGEYTVVVEGLSRSGMPIIARTKILVK